MISQNPSSKHRLPGRSFVVSRVPLILLGVGGLAGGFYGFYYVFRVMKFSPGMGPGAAELVFPVAGLLAGIVGLFGTVFGVADTIRIDDASIAYTLKGKVVTSIGFGEVCEVHTFYRQGGTDSIKIRTDDGRSIMISNSYPRSGLMQAMLYERITSCALPEGWEAMFRRRT